MTFEQRVGLLLFAWVLFPSCSPKESAQPAESERPMNASDDADGAVIAAGPTSPEPLGTEWLAFGDSETDGRAEGSVLSQIVAFETVWNGTGLGPTPTMTVNGQSGRALLESAFAYHGGTYERCTSSTDDDTEDDGMSNRAAATWVHFQESGSQGHCGESTAAEFGDTFETLVRRIRTESPNAVISTETAYSFEREETEGRDWSTYNDELRERVAVLADDDIIVHVAEVERYMQLLVDEIGFNTAITEDGGHFTGVGNLLVALAMYEALGYDVRTLDVSAATEVSAADAALCVEIVAER